VGPIQPGAATKFWIRGEHGEAQLHGKFSVAAHLDSSAPGMPPGNSGWGLSTNFNLDIVSESGSVGEGKEGNRH
jgi:hypothetical protein